MGYSVILCDLGGVVVHVEAERIIHQMSQLMNRPFEDVHRAVYEDGLLVPFELGRIAPKTYYDGLARVFGLRWSFEQFARAWNDLLRENEETISLMRRLAARCRLFALSNTNVLHLDHMRALRSLDFFDGWVASCDVGLRKPDPQIYQVALERSGAAPGEAIYIDDRPELVEAGREAGLTAIRFEHAQQLARDLAALGVA
jgi:putative hydrolase of the HAD superfamily